MSEDAPVIYKSKRKHYIMLSKKKVVQVEFAKHDKLSIGNGVRTLKTEIPSSQGSSCPLLSTTRWIVSIAKDAENNFYFLLKDQNNKELRFWKKEDYLKY